MYMTHDNFYAINKLNFMDQWVFSVFCLMLYGDYENGVLGKNQN